MVLESVSAKNTMSILTSRAFDSSVHYDADNVVLFKELHEEVHMDNVTSGPSTILNFCY